jgi:DNA primase
MIQHLEGRPCSVIRAQRQAKPCMSSRRSRLKKMTEWDGRKRKASLGRVCSEMANDSPERYVLNMAKNHRTGRIFSTICATIAWPRLLPRFHRARPGATVSMPLDWN